MQIKSLILIIISLAMKAILSKPGISQIILSNIDYDPSIRADIQLDLNQNIIGIIKNRTFTLDIETKQLLPYTALTSIVSLYSYCYLISLLNPKNFGVKCDSTKIIIFDMVLSTSQSMTDSKIYYFKEYSNSKYIIITDNNLSNYIMKLTTIPSNSSTTNYSFNDAKSLTANYIPALGEFACIYMDEKASYILKCVLLQEDTLNLVDSIKVLTTISTNYYFELCNDDKCFLLVTNDVSIIGKVITFNPTYNNGADIEIISITDIIGVSLTRMCATIFIAIFEKKSDLFIQLLTESFQRHGPLIRYAHPSIRIFSNIKGIFHPTSLIYTQFLVIDPLNPQQLGLFIHFSSCQNILYAIGINQSADFTFVNAGKMISFIEKPNDSSHETIILDINYDYPLPLKVQFGKGGEYQYTFSISGEITTFISETNTETSFIYSPPCTLTFKICLINEVPSITKNSCLIKDKLQDEMDNIMNNIEDKILTMNPKESVGNSTYELYDTSNPPPAGNSTNLSNIDLGECETVLRNHYNIPFEDSLLIFKKDTNVEGRTGNKVEYAVFMKNGSLLNMSLCDKVEIIINIPVLNTDSPEFDLIKNLSEKSKVNLYDPQDAFFNDICFSFTTNNGLDIPRKDRVKDYLQNSSAMCPHGCSVKKVDFYSNSTSCSCTDQSTPPPAPNANPFQDIKDSLMNSIINGNWKVMFCYQSVFNSKIFVKNIGNWLILVISLILTIATIVFLIQGLKNMEQYFNHIDITKRLEKRNKLREIYIKSSQQSLNSIKKVQPLSINCKSVQSNLNVLVDPNRQSQINNILIINNKDKTNNNNENISNWKKRNQSSVNTNILDINNNFSKRPLRKQAQINQVDISNLEHKKEEITRRSNQELNIINFPFTLEDYDKMPFDQCVKEDNRNFILHYWRYLKLVHPILSTFFCKAKPTVIRSILISQFFIGLMIENALSAFFYSDSYISNNYENKGSINFWYNLPIALYSFLGGTVFNIIFNLLSNVDSRIEAIEQREIVNADMFLEIKRTLKCFKIKLGFYFTLQFIMIGLCWYYTTAFCATYINSQVEWLTSGLTSIAIGLAIPFLIALIYAIIIKVSYATKCQCCFKILKFVV